jgi:hypothetical protein
MTPKELLAMPVPMVGVQPQTGPDMLPGRVNADGSLTVVYPQGTSGQFVLVYHSGQPVMVRKP